MRLVEITIKDKDGKLINLDQVELLHGQGLKGDKNARGGRRQVSILSLATKKSLDRYRDKGLCMPRFYANLIIEDLDEEKIYIGQKIQLGETSLEISEIGKECFDNCPFVQEGERCPLARKTIFAKVRKSGRIFKMQPLVAKVQSRLG